MNSKQSFIRRCVARLVRILYFIGFRGKGDQRDRAFTSTSASKSSGVAHLLSHLPLWRVWLTPIFIFILGVRKSKTPRNGLLWVLAAGLVFCDPAGTTPAGNLLLLGKSSFLLRTPSYPTGTAAPLRQHDNHGNHPTS
jgi:hypothetical protein